MLLLLVICHLLEAFSVPLYKIGKITIQRHLKMGKGKPQRDPRIGQGTCSDHLSAHGKHCNEDYWQNHRQFGAFSSLVITTIYLAFFFFLPLQMMLWQSCPASVITMLVPVSFTASFFTTFSMLYLYAMHRHCELHLGMYKKLGSPHPLMGQNGGHCCGLDRGLGGQFCPPPGELRWAA